MSFEESLEPRVFNPEHRRLGDLLAPVNMQNSRVRDCKLVPHGCTSKIVPSVATMRSKLLSMESPTVPTSRAFCDRISVL